MFRLFIRKKNLFSFFRSDLKCKEMHCCHVTLRGKNTGMKEERNGRITVWRNNTSVELPSLRCSRDRRFLISFGLLIEIFNLSPLVVVFTSLFLLLIYIQVHLILAVVGGKPKKKKWLYFPYPHFWFLVSHHHTYFLFLYLAAFCFNKNSLSLSLPSPQLALGNTR